MIDLIVAITIITGLTSTMVYSLSTFTKLIKTSGTHSLTKYEQEIIKSAGINDQNEISRIENFLSDLPNI
tara:strand:+ start:222 stop:431 length:210 start_codon:yes stop_codon:yes gene_type:complete